MPPKQRFETMTTIDIATTLETFANGDLVKLYNATSRAQINRFADRATALKRTAAAIDRVGAGELPGLLRQLGIETVGIVPAPAPTDFETHTPLSAADRATVAIGAPVAAAALTAKAAVDDAGAPDRFGMLARRSGPESVTYAGAAIAAGLTPKQARKVAERVADRLGSSTKARAVKAVRESDAVTSGKVEPTAKQAAMIALLVRPHGANRKELLAAMNAVAGASPSACIKLAELFGYDFEYIARTETTPVQYRLTAKVAK